MCFFLLFHYKRMKLRLTLHLVMVILVWSLDTDEFSKGRVPHKQHFAERQSEESSSERWAVGRVEERVHCRIDPACREKENAWFIAQSSREMDFVRSNMQPRVGDIRDGFLLLSTRAGRIRTLSLSSCHLYLRSHCAKMGALMWATFSSQLWRNGNSSSSSSLSF